MKKEISKQLIEFIHKSTSAYHTVDTSVKMLEEHGFQELKMNQTWGLDYGSKYYVVHHGSTLIAFTMGEKYTYRDSCRIAAAHSDFPCLRIKTKPDLKTEVYAQINMEVYGGAILNTWLDRPLCISGRVAIRSKDIFKPEVRLIDINRPILIIPNIAIHLNRDVNKGVELNRQTDMLPIAGLLLDGEDKGSDYFMEFLAKELEVKKEDILDFELNTYTYEEGCLVGIDESMISAPRLDNITGVHAVLEGLIQGKRDEGINVIALFDHEEIGSKTKQGAGSLLLYTVLEKIFISTGRTELEFKEMLFDSMMLSVDVGHAFHPNQGKKNDITNKNFLNGGVSIKEACNQSYATDSQAIAVVQQICDEKNIKYQKFVNRSDGTSGSTLGSIASTFIPVPTVDVGVPLLAMHSSRELMGVKDQEALVSLIREYFSI